MYYSLIDNWHLSIESFKIKLTWGLFLFSNQMAKLNKNLEFPFVRYSRIENVILVLNALRAKIDWNWNCIFEEGAQINL